MNPKRPCPVCSAISVDILHSQRFVLPEGHPLTPGYNIVACLLCEFAYADTPLTQLDYDRYYTQLSSYSDGKTSTGGVENPADWKRQQKTARQIAELLSDTSLSVIAVGCANGGILKALKDLGYHHLCGLDSSQLCVENTRQLKIEAHQGSLLQSFRLNAFDALVLSHTLEHVYDLSNALKWVENCVKDGGIVFIETPDAERYTYFMNAPFQDFNTEHINHCSLNSLRRFMESRSCALINGGIKRPEMKSGMRYPAPFDFWRRTKSVSKPLVTPHRPRREKIEAYIDRCKKILKQIDKKISVLISQSQSVVVWGTGQLMMTLLAGTSLSHFNIAASVDSNPVKQYKTLLGRPILPLGELKTHTWPILVTSASHFNSITIQIQDIGITNQIFSLLGEI